MAVLVGSDTMVAYDSAVEASDLYYCRKQAVASGTAETAHVRIYASDPQNMKVVVYSDAGSLLAASDAIAVTGSGTFSAAISTSITTGTYYQIGLITADYGCAPYHDGANWCVGVNASSSYASPSATISPVYDEAGAYGGHFAVWLESSSSGTRLIVNTQVVVNSEVVQRLEVVI